MKRDVEKKLILTLQTITIKEGIIGAIELSNGEDLTLRSLITQPAQFHDHLFEMTEAMKTLAKRITYYPEKHSPVYKQFEFKNS